MCEGNNKRRQFTLQDWKTTGELFAYRVSVVAFVNKSKFKHIPPKDKCEKICRAETVLKYCHTFENLWDQANFCSKTILVL